MSKKKKKSRKRNKTCVTLRTFFLGIEWTQMTREWGLRKAPRPKYLLHLSSRWCCWRSCPLFLVIIMIQRPTSTLSFTFLRRCLVLAKIIIIVYPSLSIKCWIIECIYLLRSERVVVSAADLLLAKDVDKVYANRSPNFFYAQIKEKKSSNQSLLIY